MKSCFQEATHAPFSSISVLWSSQFMQCTCETPRTKTNFPEGYEHSSILQMQKKKKKLKSHFRIDIMKCPGLESPPGASERKPAACHFYSEILKVDAGNCSFTCAFIFLFALRLCCVFFAARAFSRCGGWRPLSACGAPASPGGGSLGAERGLQPRRLQCGARP